MHGKKLKDNLISNKTFKWPNGTEAPWWHVKISHNFLENVTSFSFSSFAVFASEHIACRSSFLHCAVGSQTKRSVFSEQCCHTYHFNQTDSITWWMTTSYGVYLSIALLALYFQYCAWVFSVGPRPLFLRNKETIFLILQNKTNHYDCYIYIYIMIYINKL